MGMPAGNRGRPVRARPPHGIAPHVSGEEMVQPWPLLGVPQEVRRRPRPLLVLNPATQQSLAPAQPGRELVEAMSMQYYKPRPYDQLGGEADPAAGGRDSTRVMIAGQPHHQTAFRLSL